MDVYKEFKKDDQVFRIHYDHYPQNPRTEWDNLGTMVCFHNRMNLGDDNHYLTSDMFSGWDALEEYLYKKMDVLIAVPLYMMDHSGLTIRAYPFGGMYGHFDSGQIGFIYITKKKARTEYGRQRVSEKLTAKIECMLLGEVETYNQYVSNDTYTFEIVKVSTCDQGEEHEEHIDSCGGFYGSDFVANGLYESAVMDITEWTEQ